MLTRLLFVAAVCCAFTYGAVFDPYLRRYNVCKGNMDTLLTIPAGGSKCTLVQGLNNLTAKASFTSTQTTTYTSWIQTIETTIINNATITSSQAKFNLIAAAFEQLSLDYSDIYTKIQYMNISTWGPMATLPRISTEWNFQSSLELVVATSKSGNCKLFDLLLASCAGDVDKHTALSAFIESDLKVIVSDTTKTQTEIISAIYAAFQTKFFVANPTWMSYFYKLNLGGYFAFSQWSQAAVTYQRQTTITTTLSGSGMDCPFILSLNATLSSTKFTNTQKGFIKQLMNYFIQQWSTVVTVEARLELISMKFSESIDLSYSYFAVLNSIECSGFGTWWDLIIFSCQKTTIPPSCGCTVPTFPDTTTAPMVPTTTPMMETTTEAGVETSTMEMSEMPSTEATSEMATDGTSEMPISDSTSDSTWDFSTITFPSTMQGCTCTCFD